ncbi:hypothetical protein BB560_002529 [Smittium megazygosporum]|uniref:Uncharacterized protein n=1 Tax=Smittium megazygosporum TaxID=133381 RepID=A0A2T9ZEM2_9FUNG|nr:hypothetical protein BB560_002529 [Smittium megazygosporum]
MFFRNLLFILWILTGTMGHMALFSPCPRFSVSNKNCPSPPPGESYDYDIKAPIGTSDDIQSPICKSRTPYQSTTETWTAGQMVDIQFEHGGAAHGGGHCQFSLSYDGGNTFVVIHDEKRYCFFGEPSESNNATILRYAFKLPEAVPAGDRVVFAWSWINALGDREYYMNCADISIRSASSSYSGPEMLIANYGPGYPVIPEFAGNYETGLELFDKRKIISVYSSGGAPINTYHEIPKDQDMPEPDTEHGENPPVYHPYSERYDATTLKESLESNHATTTFLLDETEYPETIHINTNIREEQGKPSTEVIYEGKGSDLLSQDSIIKNDMGNLETTENQENAESRDYELPETMIANILEGQSMEHSEQVISIIMQMTQENEKYHSVQDNEWNSVYGVSSDNIVDFESNNNSIEIEATSTDSIQEAVLTQTAEIDPAVPVDQVTVETELVEDLGTDGEFEDLTRKKRAGLQYICDFGKMRCSKNGKQFLICDYRNFFVFNVAAGTRCIEKDNGRIEIAHYYHY